MSTSHQQRVRILLLLAIPLVFASGCSEQPDPHVRYLNIVRPLDDSPDVLTPTAELATGRKLRAMPAGGQRTFSVEGLAGSAAGRGEPGGRSRTPDQARRDKDYVDKADVYWKLNWIRKQLLYGPLPPDIANDIAATRKELASTLRDVNYDLADAAITQLEEGLTHLRAQEALTVAQVDSDAIPWAAGAQEVRRYIDQGRLGFGGAHALQPPFHFEGSDSPGSAQNQSIQDQTEPTLLTAVQSQAVSVAIRYAEHWQASPLEMMRRSWHLAIEKTNLLRDGLGLMHRRENSDGDLSEVNVEIGRGFIEAGGMAAASAGGSTSAAAGLRGSASNPFPGSDSRSAFAPLDDSPSEQAAP